MRASLFVFVLAAACGRTAPDAVAPTPSPSTSPSTSPSPGPIATTTPSSTNTSASGGPTTPQAVAEAALSAIRASDTAAFMKLYLDPADARRACPGVDQVEDYAKSFAKFEERTQRHLKKCATMLDWSKAQIVSVSGGDARDPVKECPRMRKARGITFKVSAGDKTTSVYLDDPMYEGDQLRLADDNPRCGKEDAPPPPAP